MVTGNVNRLVCGLIHASQQCELHEIPDELEQSKVDAQQAREDGDTAETDVLEKPHALWTNPQADVVTNELQRQDKKCETLIKELDEFKWLDERSLSSLKECADEDEVAKAEMQLENAKKVKQKLNEAKAAGVKTCLARLHTALISRGWSEDWARLSEDKFKDRVRQSFGTMSRNWSKDLNPARKLSAKLDRLPPDELAMRCHKRGILVGRLSTCYAMHKQHGGEDDNKRLKELDGELAPVALMYFKETEEQLESVRLKQYLFTKL